jgi:hypothetical protein
MSDLERALRDLEVATAAIAKMPLEDSERAEALLTRRSNAIARLVELKDSVLASPLEEQEQIVQRMRYASGGGELTELRLTGFKRKTIAEWSKWHRISQSLPAEIPSDIKRVDCKG